MNEWERRRLCSEMGHPVFSSLPATLFTCYLSSWKERKVYNCARKTGHLDFIGEHRAYQSADICFITF
jgi:hypothetical protein